jgi:transposase
MLAELQSEMELYLHPFEEEMHLVQRVVGIDATAAASILAESGTDMTRFASDKQLASWAGGCPGNKQSGGKRLSGKTTKGNPYLRAILFEVAWAIAHTKDKYLSAFYHRMARRRGKNKAILALAQKVLVIMYHILHTKKPYADLGAEYCDQRDRGRIERHHIHRLEQRGYTVTLASKEGASPWQRAGRK